MALSNAGTSRSSQMSAPRLRVRSVFISDVHLGSRDCRAEELLEFLQLVQADQLIMVGDIIEVWSLRRCFYWPESHNEVLRAISAKARSGTRVIYVPGNHDEDLRAFVGAEFVSVQLLREFVHRSADGRRWLVLHGDEFDGVVRCSPWLSTLGSIAYDVALDGVVYCNDGDWVESCTAVVENIDGRMQLLDWSRYRPEASAVAQIRTRAAA